MFNQDLLHTSGVGTSELQLRLLQSKYFTKLQITAGYLTANYIPSKCIGALRRRFWKLFYGTVLHQTHCTLTDVIDQ